MLNLSLTGVRSLVAVGAHPDDIEIAAGGLLLSLAEAGPGVRVHYVLCSGTADRQAEARAAAAAFLPGAEISFALHGLPDGRLPAHWNAVKDILHAAAAVLAPDLVICPAPNDAHQDHRLLAEQTPTVFRDQLVLHYEIPKWDGDLGRVTHYVPLEPDVARRKAELLTKAYPSQVGRDWWDDETFLGLMRLRGMEARTRYAEGFVTRKARLDLARELPR